MKQALILTLLIPFCAAAQEMDRAEIGPMIKPETGLSEPGVAADMLPEPDRPAQPETAGAYPGLPGVEYYCTDSNGARMELGEVLCITASCITWMARCEMAANNNLAMWRKLQDGCPGTALQDPSLRGPSLYGPSLSGRSLRARLKLVQPKA